MKDLCPHCGEDMASHRPLAEALLDLAEKVERPEDGYFYIGNVTEEELRIIHLALKLKAAGKTICLRAQVENWSMGRIIQEVY